MTCLFKFWLLTSGTLAYQSNIASLKFKTINIVCFSFAESQFKRMPTLHIKKDNGKFIIKFQPIRISEIEDPLVPIKFVIPDEWSDDEKGVDEEEYYSSDHSELDIDYIAPAAFMNREVKEKPLFQVMKQQYDITEVDKKIEKMKETELEAKIKAEEKERKKKEQETLLAVSPKKKETKLS